MALKASELRIGNWVYDNILEDYYKIAGFDLTQQEEFRDPIPLTEDILIKCGFECTMTDKYMGEKYRKDNYILVEDKEDISWAFGVDTYDGYYTNIKHLHQLQNLYFALTGEELEIKL